MDKYRNLYRIPSARAAWWDYSARGCYFITICSFKHTCLFGTITADATVQLSVIGKIVEQEWERSFTIRNELFCDAFVIMPNHIHAILWIDTSPVPDPVSSASPASAPTSDVPVSDTGIRDVSFPVDPLPVVSGQESSGICRPAQSISSFVAGFKSSVTRRVYENHAASGKRRLLWQPRFHDHIIRSFHHYQYILNYIRENPARWADDKFYISPVSP
ncbi:MAG: hypothetical protein LIP08_15610 [Bacteroides sp.]|nr:hypothetical protein [Bacteroides sp.]